MGHSNFLKWITLPPVVALLTFSVVRFLSDPEAAAVVDPSIWAMTMLLFIVLTVLYGLFIIHDFGGGLVALQSLAQGILLCPLALGRGAYMIQWIGVLLAACGAAALASIYHQRQMQALNASVRSSENMESRLPIPFAVTNEMGTILNVSAALLKILDLPREGVAGQNITQLLTPGEPTTELAGKTWDVTQEPMDGDRYYFQLDEAKPAPAPAPAEPEAAPAADAMALVDPATRLHSFRYAMARLEEELYRAKRYGHPLSAALFRLAFPDDAEKDDTAQSAFNAFCAALRRGLRASDTAAQASGRSLLLVFPECPKGAAELVLGRLLASVNALAPNHPVFYDVTALHVSLSFEGTDNVPDAGTLMERLNAAMEQKYSLQGGAAPSPAGGAA